MSDITLAYLYPDNSVLDVQGHNNNVHSSDMSVREGLMSTANGYLTTENLVSGFSVRKHHVMQEQAALARMESMSPTNTIYADGVAEDAATVPTKDQWFNLPGCSLRWYQPYDASVLIANWSFFTSHNRWTGIFKDKNDDTRTITPGVRLRCVIDGNEIFATSRRMAENHFHPISPGAASKPGVGEDGEGEGNPAFVDTEAHSALYWDMHYSSKTDGATAGYHEIAVQCRMSIDAADTVKLKSAGSTAFGDKFEVIGYFKLFNHISLGIRNARVLTLL
jgi:hypothetical protein